MVLTPGSGGGGAGTKITSITPPFTEIEAQIVNECFKSKMQPPTVVYVPFDPRTGQVPAEPLNSWPYAIYGDRRVYYSPNLHRAMLKYYSELEGNTLKIYAVPVLIVDYSAVIEAIYYGPEEPGDRPIDWQLSDWKQGFMWGRVKVPHEGCDGTVKVFKCDKYTISHGERLCMRGHYETYELAEGYWWVKYKAALIEVPAEVLTTDANVFKFYYKRPPGTETPLIGHIREYFFKRDIKKQVRDIMAMVGWAVEDVEVEETSDGYVVKVRAHRAGTQGVMLWLLVIGLAVIAVSFAVGAHYLYKIEAEKTRRLNVVVAATKDLGEKYEECVKNCKSMFSGAALENCIAGCAKVYADTVNNITKPEGKTDYAELIKWAVIGVVAINLIGAFSRRRE